MDWKPLYDDCRRAVDRSQAETFPYHLPKSETLGLTIDIFPGVYSTKYFTAWRFYIPHLPDVSGEDVCEVGCGHGLASLYMARQARHVVALDINPAAVTTTQHNARGNGISNIDVRLSDVFSALRQGECFDTIFWNMPWGFIPDGSVNLSLLERGNLDPGYCSIAKFFRDGPSYLRPHGRLLVVVGPRSAEMGQFWEMMKGYRVRCVASGTDQSNVDPTPDFELLELRMR